MISPKTVFSFSIEKSESENRFSTQWVVPEKLPYFEGHFPGNPTLPAVAMIDASLELLRTSLGLEVAELQTLKSAKFMAPIQPGNSLRILLYLEPSDTWRADWTILQPDGAAPVPAAILIFSLRIRPGL